MVEELSEKFVETRNRVYIDALLSSKSLKIGGRYFIMLRRSRDDVSIELQLLEARMLANEEVVGEFANKRERYIIPINQLHHLEGLNYNLN